MPRTGESNPSRRLLEFNGHEVVFSDNTRGEFELVIAATGYQIDFPFIARELLNWRDGLPRLYLHAFHPHDDFTVCRRMIQPDRGNGTHGLASARDDANTFEAREVGRAAGSMS